MMTYDDITKREPMRWPNIRSPAVVRAAAIEAEFFVGFSELEFLNRSQAVKIIGISRRNVVINFDRISILSRK